MYGAPISRSAIHSCTFLATNSGPGGGATVLEIRMSQSSMAENGKSDALPAGLLRYEGV
jgi:hypothetical protein